MSRAERDMSADAGGVRFCGSGAGALWCCNNKDCERPKWLAYPAAQAAAMERVVEAAEAWVRAQDAAKAPPYVCLSSHEWTRLCNELQDAVDTLPRAHGGEGGG